MAGDPHRTLLPTLPTTANDGDLQPRRHPHNIGHALDGAPHPGRFCAKREHLTRLSGLLYESQGHNPAWTVLHVLPPPKLHFSPYAV